MKIKRYTLFAAASLLLVACNTTDDMVVPQNGNYPSDGLVRISTTVHELKTRGEVQDYTGDSLSLSVDYGQGEKCTASNVKWATVNGGKAWTSASQMVWKNATTEAKIYAYAPYKGNVANLESVPFSVSEDQSSGLTSSDLVGYVSNKFVPGGGLNSVNALNIAFAHKLSKLTIKFTFGNEFGATRPTIASVKLNGTLPTVTYNAKADSIVAVSGSASSIKMCSVCDTIYEAILAPQSLAVNTRMVTVTLSSGKTYTYIVPASGRDFKTGLAYNMNIRVGKDELELTGVTVIDWNVGTPIADGETDLTINYAKITGGAFFMGSSTEELLRNAIEYQHVVTLTKDFKMSKCEISNSQYCSFLNANKIGENGIWANAQEYKDKILIYDCSQVESGQCPWGVCWAEDKWIPVLGYEDFPVIYVTWYGAKEFAKWLGGDLPTEAQWEYAARGSSGNQSAAIPFGIGTGKALTGDMANFNGKYPYDLNKSGTEYEDPDGIYLRHTASVGCYKPNNYGLYNMHGNVAEWCNDWYKEDFYRSYFATIDNPTGPYQGTLRVLRGGHFDMHAQLCRSAYRSKSYPTQFESYIGFRVVLPLVP